MSKDLKTRIYLTKHDELTGVFNREAYKEIREKLNKQNHPVAFILIDIDHFKEYNEEYGQETGDRLLKKAADILKNTIRSIDYVFRLGGDRFIVLLNNLDGKTEEYMQTRFTAVLDALSTSDHTAPAAQFSAGIFFSERGVDDECYLIADAALQHTKKNGYAGYTVMDKDKSITTEYHDQNGLSINMSKQKLQSSVKTGTWRIEIPKDAAPRLYTDQTMLELLGIEGNISPEECYEWWFSKIDPEYVSVVLQTVDQILAGKRAEVNYLWQHPVQGVRNIRCGGICDHESQDGHVMYGFHEDMGDIVVIRKDDDIHYMMSAMNDFLTCNIYIDLNTMCYTMIKPPEHMEDPSVNKGMVEHLSGILLKTYVSEKNQTEMKKFLQFDDLDIRISRQERTSCDYIDKISEKWQNARILPLRYNSLGRLQSVMITVISIDSEKRLKLQRDQQLFTLRTAYKQMFSKTQNFLGLIDVKNRTVKRLDMGFEDLEDSGNPAHSYDKVIAYATAYIVVPEEREIYEKMASLDTITEQLEHSHKYAFRINRKKADGTTGLFAFHYCYYDETKDQIVSMIEEVTDWEEKDPITEELNIQGFLRKCAYILENQENEYSMLLFDIKGFKAINAQFGFERGNQLIKEICLSLKESSLKPSVVARDAGDHFYCMIQKYLLDYSEIMRLCNQKFMIETTSVSVPMQCGIYHIKDRSMTVRAMCDRARLAETTLNSENTGCPYYVFTEKLNQTYLKQKEILLSLDDAVKKEEFCNYFQPIYDAKTGNIASAEALVRWIKSDGQIIPTSVFIPALEESGQIAVVDVFTGERISHFQNTRYAQGKKIIPLSVNLSRIELYNEEVLNKISESVKAAKIPCKYMRFEITESVYTDIPEHALQVMRTLREYGAKILIDDFGKGYSSLSSLTEQIFDIVKLDMSFIHKIGKNARAEAVLTSSIDMVHKMGSEVIAEGVETKEQYEFLRDQGCDYIQGYYFSKPLPQNEFEALLDLKSHC